MESIKIQGEKTYCILQKSAFIKRNQRANTILAVEIEVLSSPSWCILVSYVFRFVSSVPLPPPAAIFGHIVSSIVILLGSLTNFSPSLKYLAWSV